MYDYIFKICVFGDYNTGKSSFLNYLQTRKYAKDYQSTVGIEFSSTIIETNNDIIKVTFWDCAGQERFNSITESFFRGVSAGIIFFDVSNITSYNNVIEWAEKFRKYNDDNIPVLLIGNKIDKENRCVSQNDANILANDFNLIYIEISVKCHINIENAMDLIIHHIYKTKDTNPNIKRGTLIETCLLGNNQSNYNCTHCNIL